MASGAYELHRRPEWFARAQDAPRASHGQHTRRLPLMRKSYMSTKVICALIAIVLSPVLTLGQVRDAKKFSRLRVPDDLRGRLAERFNLFVEYERTGQYERQYDLLADEVRRDVERNDYVTGKMKAEQE